MRNAHDLADVELCVGKKSEQGYPVEVLLDQEQLFQGGLLSADLPGGSRGAVNSATLTSWFFADEGLNKAWAELRAKHPQRRVRLRIDPAARQLHALPWELLRDARGGKHLASAADTPFSRYLNGKWWPGSPTLARPLRVLVAMASPPGLKDLGLAPVDADRERAMVDKAFKGLNVKVSWLRGGFSLPELLELLVEAQQERRGYHVLHLVGQAAVDDAGQPLIYLGQPGTEGSDHQAAGVPAKMLEQMFVEVLAGINTRQEDKLRMVCLAACQGDHGGAAEAIRGHAQRLVQTGVPAVLALPGALPLNPIRQLVHTFYSRLLAHGEADLACNEAREAVRAEKLPDGSVPVLFSRLTRLLGARGTLSRGDQASERFWEELLHKIACDQCLPVLGPGVNAGLLDDNQTIARSLAEKSRYPLPDKGDLARVTQYMPLDSGVPAYRTYLNHLKHSLLRRIGVSVTGRRGMLLARGSFNHIMEDHIWARRALERHETTVFHLLASLDLPLYLTTNADNFMQAALQQRLIQRLMNPEEDAFAETGEGVVPLTEMYAEALGRDEDRRALRREVRVRQEGPRWDLSDQPAPQFLLEPPPAVNDPVVFHLNGHAGDALQRRHLVLTEEDHLSHLVRLRTRRDLVLPVNVTEALSTHSLLFLGYDMDQRELRVLLQGLVNAIDSAKDDNWNIGVQLQVEDTRDKERALSYLSKYMETFRITVYWGTVQQFIADLHARWQEEMSE